MKYNDKWLMPYKGTDAFYITDPDGDSLCVQVSVISRQRINFSITDRRIGSVNVVSLTKQQAKKICAGILELLSQRSR